MKKNNEILKEVLKEINPHEEEVNSIWKIVKEFKVLAEKKIKKNKIDAEIFVGGSFAKNTMIKKGKYDVDIFLRFDKKYGEEEISKITGKIIIGLKKEWKVSVIHGSRDYFKIDINPSFFIEVIPVIKVKNPKEARNITDLSYFHVNYIKRKMKKEMIDDVKLAKAFCHANDCYGAESYIKGFSGYALELLIYHYKTFMNFLKQVEKIKDKEIIDIEKSYKNKLEISMNMNSAKMTSPIILIDPTYKERNALAALSRETFEKFKEVATKFLKNPSKEMFEDKKADIIKIKQNASKKNAEFILIKIITDKQEGDVAGSKLLKFYKHFSEEVKKYHDVSEKGFEYDDKKGAIFFLVTKKKKEIIISGPEERDVENISAFKKLHKDIFVKNKRIFAREKINKNIHEFAKIWMIKNAKKMKEMYITSLEII
ncbi:nucleotidyltransferase domain-containing protein [Candidatus Pacearchaeota archaeon]|jgi:tRNA nucleotidyltransferase (CCA-adding enzyme)|nr:nucleotidyltransferase domain-containing protein [Candidatus Pacearchaeota archaeon]